MLSRPVINLYFYIYDEAQQAPPHGYASLSLLCVYICLLKVLGADAAQWALLPSLILSEQSDMSCRVYRTP